MQVSKKHCPTAPSNFQDQLQSWRRFQGILDPRDLTYYNKALKIQDFNDVTRGTSQGPLQVHVSTSTYGPEGEEKVTTKDNFVIYNPETFSRVGNGMRNFRSANNPQAFYTNLCFHTEEWVLYDSDLLYENMVDI